MSSFFFILGVLFPKDRRFPLVRFELLFIVLLGFLSALLATFWLSSFHLDGEVIHADFLEYCTGTSAPYLLSTGISSKRSMLPMLLPRMFYPYFGVFDALAIASICSLAISNVCIALWARILGGRTAGYVALCTTICLGPLCVMGHVLSSYPEMSLCFIMGGAATAWGIRYPSMKSIFCASCAIGCTLLADPRGLLWGLSFIGLLLLRIIFHKKRIPFLSIFCGLLYLSWRLGSYFYVPEAIGFEEQVDFRPMIHRLLGDSSPYSPPFQYSSRWVWGLVPPQEMLDTLLLAFLLCLTSESMLQHE